MRTLLAFVISLLSLLFGTAPAAAQEGINVTAAAKTPTVAAGTTATIEVTFTFANELHIWPNKPILPKGMEAKLHQTAWAIRERSGLGTVILLAGDPVFRAQAPFTRRLLFNAIFFGPYRPVTE